MKRVQVTIHPGDSNLPFTFERITEVDEPFVQVWVLNWNVATSPAAFLLQLSGDWQRFETVVEEDPAIDEFEMIPVSETESYCFVAGTGTGDARALWEIFKTGSLMTIPPARWNAGGSYTFTIVGREEDIQRAIDGVPDEVRVEIDSVGGTKVTPDSVIDRLSSRQREAVEVAVRLGYYDSQRKATTEEIAQKLDCSTSTAAEHLRKAESKVVTGLFEDLVG